MEGWKLKSGTVKHHYFSEQDLWSLFDHFFSKASKTTTYKLAFMRALSENLYNTTPKLVISYSHLFSSFSRLYWNLTVKLGLKQTLRHKHSSKVVQIINTFHEHLSNQIIDFDSLSTSKQKDLVSTVQKAGKQYVVGAVYGDMQASIYSFDNSEECLQFNPVFYGFLQRHLETLNRLNNYEFIKLLEQANEAEKIRNIIEAIENVTKRSDLTIYRNLLGKLDKQKCFYCGKKQYLTIDHFIPWSFVQNDQLWNLVFSCRSCNSKKSTKLPTQKTLECLTKRNDNIKKNCHDDIVQEKMHSYTVTRLKDLYYFAKANGYRIDPDL